MAEETGATACVVASNFVLGDAYMRQGQFGAAKIAFERGDEVAEATEQRMFRPSIAAYLRSQRGEHGRLRPECARLRRGAGRDARESATSWGEANVIWQRAETESKRPPSGEQGADAGRLRGGRSKRSRRWARGRSGARPARLGQCAARRRATSTKVSAKLRAALALFDELGIEREADGAESGAAPA